MEWFAILVCFFFVFFGGGGGCLLCNSFISIFIGHSLLENAKIPTCDCIRSHISAPRSLVSCSMLTLWPWPLTFDGIIYWSHSWMFITLILAEEFLVVTYIWWRIIEDHIYILMIYWLFIFAKKNQWWLYLLTSRWLIVMFAEELLIIMFDEGLIMFMHIAKESLMVYLLKSISKSYII